MEVFPHRDTAGWDSQSDSPHIGHTAVLQTRRGTDTVPSPEHNRTPLVTPSHSTSVRYHRRRTAHVFSCCLWSSCLVTDLGQRVGRITAAGLTSGRSVHLPVSVLALVAEDAHHPLPAGTLSCQRVTEAGTPQRTVGPPPITRALWQPAGSGMSANAKPPSVGGDVVLTFAVLFQSVAVVTRLAALAVRSHGVVEAAQAFSRHAVTGVLVARVDVVVAETQLTPSTWQGQVAIVTRAASVTVWS